MYTKRIQIVNYGPIENLDISLPVEGGIPKPIVLVGENGTGKSIVLSHIVNGLISAKDLVYPDTPEVDAGKVYKLRSNGYIRSGANSYFSRVDFEDQLHIGELRSRISRQEYSDTPSGLSTPDAQNAWNKMPSDQTDHLFSNIFQNTKKIKEDFSTRCIQYFPHNRFEEPAWLNQENLKNRAEYMNATRIEGSTNRRIINYSPLRNNQNWS